MKYNSIKIVIISFVLTTFMSCMTADEIRERAKALSPNEYVFVKAESGKQGKIDSINANDLSKLLKEDKVSIVDLRANESYKKGSIEGAINVPFSSGFKKDIMHISNYRPIAVFAQEDSILQKASRTMQLLGFSKILQLKGGIKTWKDAGNSIVSYSIVGDKKHLDVSNFNKAVLTGYGQLVDIRTPHEYENYHIPGAIMIDYKNDNFESEFEKLDKNTPVLIYCRSGVRSGNAVPILEKMGFEVLNLNDGMLDWRANHMLIEGKDVNAQDAGEEGC